MCVCVCERGGEFLYVCASVGVCGERGGGGGGGGGGTDRQRQRFSARPLFQSQSRAKSNLPPLVLLYFCSAAKSPTNVAVSRLILNRRPGCLTVCFADRILRQCFLFCSLLAHNYKAPLKF